MGYSKAGGKLTHEKKPEAKNLVTLSPLNYQQFDNCFHCLPPVLLTPVANLPPVSTMLAKMEEKFATGVVDTAGAS